MKKNLISFIVNSKSRPLGNDNKVETPDSSYRQEYIDQFSSSSSCYHIILTNLFNDLVRLGILGNPLKNLCALAIFVTW